MLQNNQELQKRAPQPRYCKKVTIDRTMAICCACRPWPHEPQSRHSLSSIDNGLTLQVLPSHCRGVTIDRRPQPRAPHRPRVPQSHQPCR